MPFPSVPEAWRPETYQSADEELSVFVAEVFPRVLSATVEAFVDGYHPSLRARAGEVHSLIYRCLELARRLVSGGPDAATYWASALSAKRAAARALALLDNDNRELEILDASVHQTTH